MDLVPKGWAVTEKMFFGASSPPNSEGGIPTISHPRLNKLVGESLPGGEGCQNNLDLSPTGPIS